MITAIPDIMDIQRDLVIQEDVIAVTTLSLPKTPEDLYWILFYYIFFVSVYLKTMTIDFKIGDSRVNRSISHVIREP